MILVMIILRSLAPEVRIHVKQKVLDPEIRGLRFRPGGISRKLAPRR